MKQSAKEKLENQLADLQQCVANAVKNHQQAIQDLQTWEQLKIAAHLTYESIPLRIVNNAFKKRVQRSETWLTRWQQDVAKVQLKINAKKEIK